MLFMHLSGQVAWVKIDENENELFVSPESDSIF